MKKLKNIIISMLIMLNIINSFVFFPKKVYASSGNGKSTLGEITLDYNTYMEDSESGSSIVGSNKDKKPYRIEKSTIDSVVGNFVKSLIPLPVSIRIFMTIVTISPQYVNDVNYGSYFSIQKVVFNKIDIFDINFFDNKDNYSEIYALINKNVSKWYYILRNVAIVFMLAILIYTAIRMAISSVAMEKAKYKKMLIGWFEGFAFLMLLPYIMVIILTISQVLLNLLESIMTSICGEDIINLEENIFSASVTSTEKGFSLIIPTIMYYILTFYQVKFFWMYAKRLFNTAFLIIISPLVIVQNAFDKAGNGQSSAFKMWTTEFAINVLIQPMHALIYIVFMSMASNIVDTAPILALVFISALSRGERVMRNILRIKNTQTVQSLKDNISAKEAADTTKSIGELVSSGISKTI